MRSQLPLRGCAPEPLIHYLKALGVLRLVVEGEFDTQARAAWHGDTFVLETDKSEDQLVDFFLNEYRPTPIVAPWNGSSGFYPKDKKQREALESLCGANPERFAEYGRTLEAARLIVGGRTEQPKDDEKMAMLQLARQRFPDRAVEWLDAAFVLGQDKPDYPPILGSGGNDGRLDFTVNFCARLLSVLPETRRGEKRPQERLKQSIAQLRAALYSDEVVPLEKAAVGQFHPAGAGGANAEQGATGESYVNPWDFILALEGSLMLASAAVRQLAAGARTRASFPFTVQNSNVGYGTATDGEKIRAEIWLPLWSRFAAYPEVAHIFKEGRVQFGNRRPVRTGFDFARAVAELGVDRGIEAFQRYAFIERNGQANLATPLGIFYVEERPLAALVQEADRWLDSFRRATSDEKKTPPRFVRARKRIEEAIFKLCARGDAEDLRETFVALGAAEAELANGERFRGEKNLRPLTGLSRRWLKRDGRTATEFEIAVALAAIAGDGKVGALRSNLEPFDWKTGQWDKNSNSVVWSAAALEENLAAVLHRRSVEARMNSLSHSPLSSSRFASLKAIDAFLSRDADDESIEELLRSLVLLDWGKDEAAPLQAEGTRYVPPSLPRAYALLKLLFLSGGKFQPEQGGEIIIKHEPTVVPLLRAGRVADALEVAGRRLKASGLVPLAEDFFFPREDGVRLAAALLIPIDEPSVRALAGLVLRKAAEDQPADET
jgi:CRISPR-associated protein Csx17